MKTKLMSKSHARMNDTELACVVGGFFTAYVFPYLQVDGKTLWFDKPLTVGLASTNPYSAILTLVRDNMDMLTGNKNAKSTTTDEFNKFIKNFNNKNGSQWKKPSTYGNIVATVNLATMNFDVA